MYPDPRYAACDSVPPDIRRGNANHGMYTAYHPFSYATASPILVFYRKRMHNVILFSDPRALLCAIHRPRGDDRIAGDHWYR